MLLPGFSTLLTAVMALAAVLGLIWLASRAARIGGLAPRRTNGRLLTVRDVIALDTRRRLHLVRCGDRDVLLLTGGGHDVVVGWIDGGPNNGGKEGGEQPGMTAAGRTPPPNLGPLRGPSPQAEGESLLSPAPPSRSRSTRSPSRLARILCLAFLLPLLLPLAAHAQSVNIDLGAAGQAGATSRIIQLTALVTVLSLAPSLLVMITAFTRIIIVLSLLRTALATQSTPPNMVLIGLALFLTFFVMEPTLNQAWTLGIAPMEAGRISDIEGIQRAIEPFHRFMIVNLRPGDLRFFLDLAHLPAPALPDQAPWRAVVPAFLVGELRRAFEMGFLLFLPFLVIDMVVASVLMSLGMMMLPPSVVSLPFKLIFFVLVDGWRLVAGSLVQSFIGQ